ncbi:hypothetical protein B0H13DRAFT_2310227 [Mycena leptocephala]|nr:hypothetical protein B0H13DRAFT_2310227 [Mycena leptocephala]
MTADVPSVEEPRRSAGFGFILSGELELEPRDMAERAEDGEEEKCGGVAVYDVHSRAEEAEFETHVTPEVRQPVIIALEAPQEQQWQSQHLASPIAREYNHQELHHNSPARVEGWAEEDSDASGDTGPDANSQGTFDRPSPSAPWSHPTQQIPYMPRPEDPQYTRPYAEYCHGNGAEQGCTHAQAIPLRYGTK